MLKLDEIISLLEKYEGEYDWMLHVECCCKPFVEALRCGGLRVNTFATGGGTVTMNFIPATHLLKEREYDWVNCGETVGRVDISYCPFCGDKITFLEEEKC